MKQLPSIEESRHQGIASLLGGSNPREFRSPILPLPLREVGDSIALGAAVQDPPMVIASPHFEVVFSYQDEALWADPKLKDNCKVLSEKLRSALEEEVSCRFFCFAYGNNERGGVCLLWDKETKKAVDARVAWTMLFDYLQIIII